MNILITGHEGMVGTYLAKYLIDNGNHNIIKFEGDVAERDDWEKYYRQHIDTVIHLAALAGVRPSIENPELYYHNNVIGTQRMLEFSEYHYIERTLYASSSNAAEWWTNPYGTTKKMNEIQASRYEAIGMRFHTIWPGRDDMLYRKLQNGEVTMVNAGHTRDMIHVEDVSSAINVLLDNFDTVLNMKDGVVDIGTGESFAVADIAKAYGYAGEYTNVNPSGERIDTKADIEWLTDLGWKPKWNIIKDANRNFE